MRENKKHHYFECHKNVDKTTYAFSWLEHISCLFCLEKMLKKESDQEKRRKIIERIVRISK